MNENIARHLDSRLKVVAVVEKGICCVLCCKLELFFWDFPLKLGRKEKERIPKYTMPREKRVIINLLMSNRLVKGTT